MKKILADLCRVVLGLTFVFSGFVKTIDPWGTALKIGEYLNVYGAGAALSGVRIPLSVLFCAAELVLGLMLVFRVKVRLTSIIALGVMLFFLVVTFLSATVLPVEDCGCFGDAVHLSPWVSFGKNTVLFVLAAIVWWNARRRGDAILPVTRREWITTAVFVCFSVGLGIGCLRHLPLMDFLPFKKGINLYEAKYGESSDDGGSEGDIALREFVLFNSGGDATYDILSAPGKTYILLAARLADIKPPCAERMERLVYRALTEGSQVVLATSSPLSDDETMAFGSSAPVPVYNLDSGTMITMLRARAGVVVIENGVITGKKNCRDIK